jgi:hypothetical protein
MNDPRDILCQLRGMGARLEHQNGRLVLRAGKRSVPEPLVEQVRAIKGELLMLLGGVDDPNQSLSPYDKKAWRSSRESTPRAPETPGFAEGRQVGALREVFAEGRQVGGCAHEHSSEERQKPTMEAPKDATLALLDESQHFRGLKAPIEPKDATESCRRDLRHAAAQQPTTSGSIAGPKLHAIVGSRPACCECGTAIVEPVMTWWGGQPCHRDCGETAFRQTKMNRS